MAAYLSSISARTPRRGPGLGAYAVSKAALEKLIEAWRAEHPAVGFTRVIVGDCAGGEGPVDDRSSPTTGTGTVAAEFHPIWEARNYIGGALVDVDELVRVVDTVLRCGATASIPSVAVIPRRPADARACRRTRARCSGQAGSSRPDEERWRCAVASGKDPVIPELM